MIMKINLHTRPIRGCVAYLGIYSPIVQSGSLPINGSGSLPVIESYSLPIIESGSLPTIESCSLIDESLSLHDMKIIQCKMLYILLIYMYA